MRIIQCNYCGLIILDKYETSKLIDFIMNLVKRFQLPHRLDVDEAD